MLAVVELVVAGLAAGLAAVAALLDRSFPSPCAQPDVEHLHVSLWWA